MFITSRHSRFGTTKRTAIKSPNYDPLFSYMSAENWSSFFMKKIKGGSALFSRKKLDRKIMTLCYKKLLFVKGSFSRGGFLWAGFDSTIEWQNKGVFLEKVEGFCFTYLRFFYVDLFFSELLPAAVNMCFWSRQIDTTSCELFYLLELMNS